MRLGLPVLNRTDSDPTLTSGHSGGPIERDTPPEEVVRWAVRRFEGWRTVATTSFGMEGCALIDMIARHGVALRIVYIDTHFFFPETYALRDRMIRRYPHLTFVNGGTTMTAEQQEREHGPELWRSNPDLCCHIRKVKPMRRVLRDADVWLTGLRREQSSARSALQLVEWDWQFELLKISPLAAWSRADVWSYIRRHGVPFNPLHERGYPSIGCTHCTRSVDGATPAGYSRDGRWTGRQKTECGLHDGTASKAARDSIDDEEQR